MTTGSKSKGSARNRLCKRGGSSEADLSSILPKSSYYQLNSNIQANPVDSRSTGPLRYTQRGGKRKHRNKSNSKSKSKEKKIGYVNYAGRQIGCLSQRRSQRRSQRQRRTRAQSGGDAFSYLPQDVNMAARSATTFVGNLWADLQGTHHTVSPLPFSDQAIQSTSGKPTQ